MRRQLVAVLALGCILGFPGCKRKQPQATSQPAAGVAFDGADSRAQVRVGTPANDQWGYLPFRIDKVYQQQRAIAEVPGHQDGGDWTFMDCVADSSAGQVRFTVGVEMASNAAGQRQPFSWGKATMRTADRESGAAFVKRFAEAFHGTAPAPRQPKPLGSCVFSTAILGEHLKRSAPGGGFSGKGGTWTATKWFPTQPGIEAEVYFNYSLATKEGEFSEKDEEYRQDLAQIWATVLRDGPRGQRAPAEDPNIATSGPRLGSLSRLEAVESSATFSPDGGSILYSTRTNGRRSELWYSAVSDIVGTRQRVAEMDGEYLQWVSATPDAQVVLVCERLPRTDGDASSLGRQQIWYLDRRLGTKRQITGPWGQDGDFSVREQPLSPDGKYLVIRQWRQSPDQKIRYSVLHLVDIGSGAAKAAEIQGHSLHVQNWRRTGAGWEIVALTGSVYIKDEPRRAYVIAAETGQYRRDASLDPVPGPTIVRSPDGQREALINDRKQLVVHTPGGASHTLGFHPDDLRFVNEWCLSWVDNRYLLFASPEPMLIDTETMRMSYLGAPAESVVEFNSGFSHAIVRTPDGICVAPVIHPQQ